MEPTVVLGFITGLIHILGSLFYLKRVLSNINKPNATTWVLWTLISATNSLTYLIMTGDWVKSLLPIASFLATAIILLLASLKGKLSKLQTIDTLALIIGLIAMLIWWQFKSATYANLIIQLTVIISIIPTFVGTLKHNVVETPLPWFLWSMAYSLSIIVIILRWQHQLQDLAYPLVSLILHCGVGVVVIYQEKKTLKNLCQY